MSNVAGRVVSQLHRGETPLYDVTVKILDRKNRVVAQSVTHDDGLFDFGRTIKPGKYFLDVDYKRLLAPYWSPLNVVRRKRNVPLTTIVVTLGADLIHPCGGTYAELR